MHTISTSNGAKVNIVNRGAAIASFQVPVKGNGTKTREICLGFDERIYSERNTNFFGASIGRIGNRIKNAQFDLDGKTIQLNKNHGKHALHGGNQGFDKKDWQGPSMETRHGKECAVYRLESPDGDENYPGTLQVLVSYHLDVIQERTGGKTVLEVEFEAALTDNSPRDVTAVGLTNHSYFNVGDQPSLEGTQVTLPSTQYIEVDDLSIPTGKIGSFPGLEANKPTDLGATKPFIDHCFVANPDPKSVRIDTRSDKPRLLVRQHSPATGLTLEVASTEPAVQIYTGDGIDIKAGGKQFGKRAGMAIEPQRYIDAVNHDDWKHMMTLHKGETYGARSTYTVWHH